MYMPSFENGASTWWENLNNAYAIHNVLSVRTELPFFLINWDGKNGLDWMELSDPRHVLKPYHFEIYFGKESVRDDHYLTALRAATERHQIVVKNVFGFWDLFYRLPADDSGKTFLFAGQFLREQPHWPALSRSWRDLTGQEPASANRDFYRFVKMALSLPVLEPELLKAVKSFVKLYARYLSGQGQGDDIQQAVDKLNRDSISPLWPIDEFVDNVISPDKFRLPHWYYDGKLADWIKEGMGITRLPTTAMALMPVDDKGESLDPIQAMVRNAEIQRECITFVRNMPEAAATRLQDYGVSIIASCKKRSSKTAARLALQERAEQLRSFVRERFNVRSVVGIGPTLFGGTSLYESHRDAVLTAHMCIQLGKSVLFFDRLKGSKRPQYADLQQAADSLGEALDRQNSTELKLACDRYVTLVLQYSGGRIEVIRSHFLATIFQLLKSVKRRNPMKESAYNSFAREITGSVEEARTTDQVIESLNSSVQRLGFVSAKVWRGPTVMLLEATLQYLKDNYFEDLPLPVVARQAGFSVPAFTRAFKQATGTSYLAYLRSIRVERAKKLLTSTAMTVEQIAQTCGFHSQHHLIRSFKKVTGETPGAFRDTHAIVEDD